MTKEALHEILLLREVHSELKISSESGSVKPLIKFNNFVELFFSKQYLDILVSRAHKCSHLERDILCKEINKNM